MKLRLSLSIILLASTAMAVASPVPINSTFSGKFYVGAFGGGGASNNFNATQLGTVFFLESFGGPLSVNAFGRLTNQNGAFFGGQLGYEAPAICLNACSQWKLKPGAELEGYYMNKNSSTGALINNTTRIPVQENDFRVSYPMDKTVFLINAVLNFNKPCFCFHPYVGLGIGNAIVRISDASAFQANPLDAPNHYNGNANDTNSTFAGQLKLGLNYDFNRYVSLFAEYRWLYVANTHFVLGSTIAPAHSETTPWQVKLNNQSYNLGNIGLRVNW